MYLEVLDLIVVYENGFVDIFIKKKEEKGRKLIMFEVKLFFN